MYFQKKLLCVIRDPARVEEDIVYDPTDFKEDITCDPTDSKADIKCDPTNAKADFTNQIYVKGTIKMFHNQDCPEKEKWRIQKFKNPKDVKI